MSVIGAGNVGGATAQLVMQSGLADVVLFDIVEGVPQGKALDLTEAAPLWNVAATCRGTNDIADTKNSDIVIITAGLARKPGMSRDDLLLANAKVIKNIVSEVSALSKGSIFLVVTNPMDVMAQLTWSVSGFSPQRVIGMGGVLDSSRFRTFISMKLGISPSGIEAVVLGGHGDQMVPLPSYTTVQGVPLTELLSRGEIDELIRRTRQGGAEIVSLLKTGSAFYAPAASVFQMTKAILLDEKRVLPCSVYIAGEYGQKEVFTGVPVVLGSSGAERVIELKLRAEERRDFERSAQNVRDSFEKIRSV